MPPRPSRPRATAAPRALGAHRGGALRRWRRACGAPRTARAPTRRRRVHAANRAQAVARARGTRVRGPRRRHRPAAAPPSARERIATRAGDVCVLPTARAPTSCTRSSTTCNPYFVRASTAAGAGCASDTASPRMRTASSRPSSLNTRSSSCGAPGGSGRIGWWVSAWASSRRGECRGRPHRRAIAGHPGGTLQRRRPVAGAERAAVHERHRRLAWRRRSSRRRGLGCAGARPPPDNRRRAAANRRIAVAARRRGRLARARRRRRRAPSIERSFDRARPTVVGGDRRRLARAPRRRRSPTDCAAHLSVRAPALLLGKCLRPARWKASMSL